LALQETVGRGVAFFIGQAEGAYMSLNYCVRHNGKIYCWDHEDETIKEITVKEINFSNCPEIIVIELLRLLDNSKKTGQYGFIGQKKKRSKKTVWSRSEKLSLVEIIINVIFWIISFF